MAAVVSVRRDIWKLPLSLVRWRHHFDPKHPKHPHFERAKFLAAAEPIYARDTRTPQMKCDFVRIKKETHREAIPYEKLLAKVIRKNFEKSEFVAVYHLNELFQDEVLDTERIFFKHGLHYFVHPTEILSYVVKDTKFSPLNQFFNCLKFEAIVFCDHKSDVVKVLSIQKKTPKLILLGGVLEERLMSKNDLIAYSKLPELPIARAQLCHTLNQAAQQTVGYLSHHQTKLSQMLNQHSENEIKDKE